MKTALILGITSDIGRELALRFAGEGWQIAGTHRSPVAPKIPGAGKWTYLPCDLSSTASVDGAIKACRDAKLQWDLLVLAAGTEEPIGPFFAEDPDSWDQGVAVNALGPLRFLRGVYPLRNQLMAPAVAMFSGAGTNGTAPSYSCYCASKILLIKMCELLDSESQDTSFFIVGPGIVRTKIHDQTLAAGARSGNNLQKVGDFLNSPSKGTSHEDIHACLKWCLAAGKSVVGGRNIALVHDHWRVGDSLGAALRQDPNLYKLRRNGNHLDL
jgi:NAD(P)-dependent dehydrogenase (short-subunit alcohol dehydrogenase family)